MADIFQGHGNGQHVNFLSFRRINSACNCSFSLNGPVMFWTCRCFRKCLPCTQQLERRHVAVMRTCQARTVTERQARRRTHTDIAAGPVRRSPSVPSVSSVTSESRSKLVDISPSVSRTEHHQSVSCIVAITACPGMSNNIQLRPCGN